MQIERQLAEILGILESNPQGMRRGEISEKLSFIINNKTLQRRLGRLQEQGSIWKEGERRAARYFPVLPELGTGVREERDISKDIFSKESQNVLKFLERPAHSREKVSYNRGLLEEYVPNQTFYVPNEKREALHKAGRRVDERLAAGTYARQICQRLLIDLSYNSSRLEGNTYSKLDTQRLIERGISAEGKVREETVMIMNHKEAILFLVENAQDVQLAPFTIFNLHNLLSQDLLPNPESCGRIRRIEVDIGKSTYKPLNNPHQLAELFELILVKARKIEDPVEQSFFVLVHLSYLQAFEDVNKRTARLSCNIPFIKENLCPLSFTDVARDDYSAAFLSIYEANEIRPLLDLYCRAYRRSCEQYRVVKDSLGEIDGFRIEYRQQRKDVMGQIVRKGLHGVEAEVFIEAYCQENKIGESDRFTAMTLADLKALHPGAIIGLGITEGDLQRWGESPNPE